MTSTAEDSKSGASTYALHALVPPTLDELNHLVSGYEFLELVDRGGMGVVYRARQKSLNRIVAVKTLPPASQNRRTFAARFKRESEALASLNHPNIIAVYDSGETSTGLLYYVMEFVHGSNLRHMIKSGALNTRQMLAIVMQVCGAVQYAHDHGVVHRDIKPANILIDKEGHVKVADFGLAKVLGGPHSAADLTSVCETIGTPDYIAPEAMNEDTEVDHRADIFSLGVMLYEMFTGRVPKGVWELPSRCGADERLDEVVRRALQSDPQSRYQSVNDLTQELQVMMTKDGGPPTSGARPSGTRPTQPLTTPMPMTTPMAMTTAPADGGDEVSSALVTVAPLATRPAARWRRVVLRILLGLGIVAILLWQAPTAREWFAQGKKPASAPLPEAPPKTLVQPPTPSPSIPKVTRESQRALAVWVFAHGGLINLKTPGQKEPKLSDDDGFRSFGGMPDDYIVVRVSFAEMEEFNDKHLGELLTLAEKAKCVTHLCLRGTSVTPRGLVSLPVLKNTLTSLNIRNTTAFSAKTMPAIAACTRLDGLYLTLNSASDSELVDQLQSQLSTCGIFADP